MIKYAKIVDGEKGLCQIGLGTNEEFYISMGMELLDVQQSNLDGQWYLKEKCPMKTDEQKVIERESKFNAQFFEIENVGWFRKAPKGYNSAVESINTAFNMVSLLTKLPANTLTFYNKPDFTDQEQCTEEWLVSNSFKNEEMTIEEFAQFYANFMTAWNNQEHL